MEKSSEKYTKYEEARIVGARALQISMNAPIILKISKEELEKINYDPLKIAELEYKSSVLPITVKRPLPKKKKHLRLAEEIPEVEEEEEKEKEKAAVSVAAAEVTEVVEGEELEEVAEASGEAETEIEED